MRALIRFIDGLMVRAIGVFEFTDDPACLLRLRWGRAHTTIRLGDETIAVGDPVLELHVWNDHVPPTPAEGPDLAWASRAFRLWVTSLRNAARYLQSRPDRETIRAVTGTTGLFPDHGDGPGAARFMERLGFAVMPYQASRLRLPWENLYSWLLIWAYSPGSLRFRRWSGMRRLELWMPAEAFVRRFGTQGD